MDSKDHPVVQQGIKAAELTSEVNIEVIPVVFRLILICGLLIFERL